MKTGELSHGLGEIGVKRRAEHNIRRSAQPAARNTSAAKPTVLS
jgi:hypothetical protein